MSWNETKKEPAKMGSFLVKSFYLICFLIISYSSPMIIIAI